MLALLLPDCPHPAGERWVARRTGYTRKTAREGLQFLHDVGLTAQGPRGWLLNEGAKQLPLPFKALSEGEGKFYPFSSSSSSNKERNSKRLEEEEESDQSEGKFYPHGKSYPQAVDNFSDEERAAFDLLRDAGTGRAMALRLAHSCPSPDYVKAHLAKIERDGEPLRYALQRMKCGDPLPRDPAGERACPECGKGLFGSDGRCLYCLGVIQS